MSDDIKDLLSKNLEVSKETLRLVQKMHRAAMWARLFNLLKWLLILGVMVWSYLALQPYLQKFLGISQQLGGLQNSLPKNFDVNGLLKNFAK